VGAREERAPHARRRPRERGDPYAVSSMKVTKAIPAALEYLAAGMEVMGPCLRRNDSQNVTI